MIELFIVGLLIVGSWIGWGYLISLSPLIEKKTNIGLQTGLGLAFTIIIGGILNVSSLISPLSLEVLGVIGLVLFLYYIFKVKARILQSISTVVKIKGVQKTALFFTLVLLTLILLKYLASISQGNFNGQDDFQGYFVFVEKMIQTGSLGHDPFSERRIVSSLGGQSFLQTFVLISGHDKNLGFLDKGVGFIAFLLTLTGFFIEMNIPRKYVYALLFAAVLIPAPILNITSMYTAMALFTTLIHLFYNQGQRRNIIVCLAFIMAAICALKNSFAVVCILFGGAYLIVQYFSKRSPLKQVIIDAVAIISLTLVLLLPWMISSYASSGTLFYPLLGKGYHGSQYGTFLSATSEMNINNVFYFAKDIDNLIYYVFATLILMLFIFRNMLKFKIIETWAVIGVCFLTIILLGAATGGYDVYRYTFAIVFPVILIVLAVISGNRFDSEKVRSNDDVAFGSICIIGALIGAGIYNFSASELDVVNSLKFGFKNKNVVSAEEIYDIRKMQSAVPEKQIIIARLDKNFLFDFKRNEIFIADYPGGASLPPGMPSFKGGEALAEYLIKKGMYYIAYSYKNEAGFSQADFGFRLAPDYNAWLRTEAKHTFDFQDNLKELGNSHKRIYDNGKNFIIDLRIPANK